MHLSFSIDAQLYRADLRQRFDLAPAQRFDASAQPNAFHLQPARATPVQAGDFIGSTRQGGSVNCFDLQLNPHGNGCHTESAQHLGHDNPSVLDCLQHTGHHFPAVLCSLPTRRAADLPADDHYLGPMQPDDQLLTLSDLRAALDRLQLHPDWFGALLLRSLPNHPAKKASAHYSGANPAYLSSGLTAFVRHQLRTEHLLVDLPSVDREQDDGLLPNHHTFFGLPQGKAHPADGQRLPARTITEMFIAPDALPDGPYLLELQIPAFALDAAPSRPLLYTVEPLAP